MAHLRVRGSACSSCTSRNSPIRIGLTEDSVRPIGGCSEIISFYHRLNCVRTQIAFHLKTHTGGRLSHPRASLCILIVGAHHRHRIVLTGMDALLREAENIKTSLENASRFLHLMPNDAPKAQAFLDQLNAKIGQVRFHLASLRFHSLSCLSLSLLVLAWYDTN